MSLNNEKVWHKISEDKIAVSEKTGVGTELKMLVPVEIISDLRDAQ